MKSCTASEVKDAHFLAVIMNNVDTTLGFIKIYKLNNDKLEFYQAVHDPKIIAKSCDPSSNYCTDYKDQQVDFGSDFEWDTQTCGSFFVGAPSSKTYSRVYLRQRQLSISHQ